MNNASISLLAALAKGSAVIRTIGCIREALCVFSGLWVHLKPCTLWSVNYRKVHGGKVSAVWKTGSSEVRKSWVQISFLSIQSYVTLGKSCLNFLCLSFLTHSDYTYPTALLWVSNDREWLSLYFPPFIWRWFWTNILLRDWITGRERDWEGERDRERGRERNRLILRKWLMQLWGLVSMKSPQIGHLTGLLLELLNRIPS